MTLLTILGPTSQPVPRADLIAQLRLDAAVADANQLERLDQMIADASAEIARRTGLTLAPTDFELRLDAWPHHRRVPLPASPIRGVDTVSYIAEAGSAVTLASDRWQFFPGTVGGDLWFAADFDRPALADWPGSVRIRFAAGFDDPTATGSGFDPRLSFDGRLRQTVIMLAAAWYDDRGTIPPEVETAIERAVARARVYR